MVPSFPFAQVNAPATRSTKAGSTMWPSSRMPSLLRRWHWVHKDLVVQYIHIPNLGSRPNWYLFSLHSHVPKYPKNSSNYVLSRGARPLRGAAGRVEDLDSPFVASSWASYKPAKFCEKSAFPLLRVLAGSCTRRARGWLSLLWRLPYWCKSYCCTLLVWKTANDHVYTCLYGLVYTVTCTSPCRCSWPCQETMNLETCDHSSLELH